MKIIRNIRNERVVRVGQVVLAAGVAVSGTILFASAASAVSGGSSNTAVLSVTGPSPFQAKLSTISVGTKKVRTATIHPVILNTGTGPASLTFGVSLDASDGVCANPGITVKPDNATPATLAAGDSVAPILTMTMDQDCPGIDGTILVMGGSGVTSVPIRFALMNSVQESQYWYPIFYGLGAGLLFWIVMVLIVLFYPWDKFGKLGATVATGPSWSFSSSWLTSITALGAILGTVLGATGFLADVLPGTPTGRFVGLSLLFGGFVITAPIIYSAASKWVFDNSSGTPGAGTDTLIAKGRVWGVITATAVTVAGVIGELGTLLILAKTSQDDATVKDFISALLVVAGAVTLYYSASFVLGVSKEENTGVNAKPTSASGTP